MAYPDLKLPEQLRKHFAYDPAERSLLPAGDHFRVIASAPDYAIARDGTVVRIRPKDRTRIGKVLTHIIMSNGYPSVSLRVDGRPMCQLIHRLVCQTFHGPAPTPKHEVAHRDGRRRNCHADNLRWATHAENEADKEIHGTRGRPSAILSEEQVRAIRAAPKYRGVVNDLARRYGVVHQTISDIRRGKNWAKLI